jgi:hypothetical protein
LVLLSENLCEIESFLDSGVPVFGFKSEFNCLPPEFGDRRKLKKISSDDELHKESATQTINYSTPTHLNPTKRLTGSLLDYTRNLSELVKKITVKHGNYVKPYNFLFPPILVKWDMPSSIMRTLALAHRIAAFLFFLILVTS